MRIGSHLLAFGIAAAWTSAALALPPRNVNTAVNRTEALQACEATCTAHAKSAASCKNQCAAAFRPFFGAPTPIDMSTYNVVSCDISNGAIWAWYAACSVEISLLSDGVTNSLGQLLNNNSLAVALMGQAAGVAGDPCGYVRDQVLAQNAARCPASPLLPKQTTLIPGK
jgi:hypothetical protein